MNDRVVIDRRFNGPPNSANGGYACGLVGTVVKAPAVRVSLRKPPPLDVALLRRREADGSVSLLSGDDVIAAAVPGAVQAQAPPAPTVEEAEIATLRYVGFAHHRFPTCFVCGTARDDGLRIYAGRVGDSPLLASPWTPKSDDPLLAWAVLDCPSAYAIESVDHRAQIVVLASLTVELRERPRGGGAARRRRLAGRQRRPQAPVGFGALRRGGTRPRRRRLALDRAARPRRFRRLSRPSARMRRVLGLLRCRAVIRAPRAGQGGPPRQFATGPRSRHRRAWPPRSRTRRHPSTARRRLGQPPPASPSARPAPAR